MNLELFEVRQTFLEFSFIHHFGSIWNLIPGAMFWFTTMCIHKIWEFWEDSVRKYERCKKHRDSKLPQKLVFRFNSLPVSLRWLKFVSVSVLHSFYHVRPWSKILRILKFFCRTLKFKWIAILSRIKNFLKFALNLGFTILDTSLQKFSLFFVTHWDPLRIIQKQLVWRQEYVCNTPVLLSVVSTHIFSSH